MFAALQKYDNVIVQKNTSSENIIKALLPKVNCEIHPEYPSFAKSEQPQREVVVFVGIFIVISIKKRWERLSFMHSMLPLKYCGRFKTE